MPARVSSCASPARRRLWTCTRPSIRTISLYFSRNSSCGFFVESFSLDHFWLDGFQFGPLTILKTIELLLHEAVTIQFTNDLINASLCHRNQIVDLFDHIQSIAQHPPLYEIDVV